MVIEMARAVALRIRDTKNITIIGCRIRDEDWLLKLLISFWESKKGTIHIIDRDNAEEIKGKITQIFMQRPNQITEGRIETYPGTMSEKLDEYLKKYFIN